MTLALEMLKEDDYKDLFDFDENLAKMVYEYIIRFAKEKWADESVREESISGNTFCVSVLFKDIVKDLFTNAQGIQVYDDEQINDFMCYASRNMCSTMVEVINGELETHYALAVRVSGKEYTNTNVYFQII